MKRITGGFILFFLLVFSNSAVAASDGEPLDSKYRTLSHRIIESAQMDEGAWEKLVYLCDRIGPRLSGSEALDQAIQWASSELEKAGLENVRKLPVEVPYWKRGEESGSITSPVERRLHVLGLGGSIPTPAEGVRAEAVVVKNFEQLKKMGRRGVEGKIVVYNVPYRGYGRTVPYRINGAIEAARLGAVAVLIRSVTAVSLQTPHTGAMQYEEETPRIPAASITIEDSLLLQRLYDSGDPVLVDLKLSSSYLPETLSANVVAEIRGRERPEEVVVLGGHIDSWDVGQGAHDDGVGVAVSIQVGALLRQLDLRPRRTVRIVLWTNEEFGLSGARAYRKWVGEDIHHHVAAIEMDAGAEKPIGFGLGLHQPSLTTVEKDRAFELASQIGQLLTSIGVDQITRGGGGADISPLMRDGVPGFGLRTVGTHYFDWHHSAADTVDKVRIEDLRHCLAAMTVLTYVLADMPDRLIPQSVH